MENLEYKGKECYFNKLNSLKNVRSNNDNNELIKKAQSGDKNARDMLILSNTSLIHKVLTSKLRLGSHPDYEDFFQMGILGLFDAIDHFDVSFGAFSTYAYYWIYQAVMRNMISTISSVKIPVYAHETLYTIKKTMAIYPEITDKDMLYELIPDKKKPPKEIYIILLNYISPLISLNQHAVSYGNDRVGTVLIDTIEDKDARFEDSILDSIVEDELFKLIESVLPKKEYDVISRHFGFYDMSEESIESIALSYGLTGERIRQIKSKAINRLRHSRLCRQYIHSYREERIPL